MAKCLKQATLDMMFCKIKDIRLFKASQPLKVFVTKKYRPGVSAKGVEYLKLILEDNSGTIQAMVYDNVEERNKIFQLNKGYIINNATVKESNKEFDTYGHDCELVITRSTNVKKCNMPAKKLVFTPLEDLPSHVLDENINIIGQVKDIGELQAHNTRIKEKTPHRQVTIKDQSGSETISLWGHKAEESIKPGDVITLSPVKLGLYKGQLSVGSRYNSVMKINPLIPEADKLRNLNACPDITFPISDSDSDISAPTRKKRKRNLLSSSSENSDAESEKAKKEKQSCTPIVEDSSEESSDKDYEAQETSRSDSDESNGLSDEDSVSTDEKTSGESTDDVMSSQNTSSSDGSLTDDDSDDERANSTHGRDDTDEHGGQLYNDKGSNEINEHVIAKIWSFVYWTVFGDKDERTTNLALSLQKEMTSKMEACVSQAWDRKIRLTWLDVKIISHKRSLWIGNVLHASSVLKSQFSVDSTALEKFPVFKPEKRDRSEIETLKDCEVCNRSNHPWKYCVTLSGLSYDSQTLKERENEDEEEFQFLMGSYCYRRTKYYHKLCHFKFKLNKECEQKINKLGDPDRLFKNKDFLRKQCRDVAKMFEEVELEVFEDGHSTRRGTRFQRGYFRKHSAHK